jgi:triacylglycerol lipase
MPFAAHHRITVAMLASLGVLATMPASAQMPPDITEKIAALGRVVDPEKTAPIYAPLQEKEPYAGLKVLRDVKYGPDTRNLVDIFAAENASGGRPVLMFVHGGAYVGGNKRPPGSPFYDNVMVWAARNGMVGVNIEYRLAPQSPWPAGAEDVGAAVRWVADSIAAHGGDRRRIFLMGHSAGATHVATYVSHPEFHGPKGSGLAGAMFSSGVFDLTKTETSEGQRAYFGENRDLYRERSALSGLLKTDIPFMMSAAELDPPMFLEQLALLKEAMCKTERGCVRSLVLTKHSHMSESYAINTPDTQLTSQLLEFIRTGK